MFIVCVWVHSTLKPTDRLFLHAQQLFPTCLALSLPILASKQEQEGKDEPRHDWNSAHFVVKSCYAHPHTERDKKKRKRKKEPNRIRKSPNSTLHHRHNGASLSSNSNKLKKVQQSQ